MRNHSRSVARPLRPESRERLVAQYRASGLTKSQFAREHDLKAGTLRQWIHRLGSQRAPLDNLGPVFQEVPLSAVPFLESWAAELRLPSGLVLRLNGQARADWVGALVERVG